jgi:hypothetical protein
VVELVRQLAANYNVAAIAVIVGKQRRRTATGPTWTKNHVKALRDSRGIPTYQPPETCQ